MNVDVFFQEFGEGSGIIGFYLVENLVGKFVCYGFDDVLQVRGQLFYLFFVDEEFQYGVRFVLVGVVVVFGDFVEVYQGIVEGAQLFCGIDDVLFQFGIDFIVCYKYWCVVCLLQYFVVQAGDVYFEFFQVFNVVDFFIKLIVYLYIGIVVWYRDEVEICVQFFLQFQFFVDYLCIELLSVYFKWDRSKKLCGFCFVCLVISGFVI